MKYGYMFNDLNTCNNCFAKDMVGLMKEARGLDMIYFDDNFKQPNLNILLGRIMVPGSILYVSELQDLGKCPCEIVQRLKLIDNICSTLFIGNDVVCIGETIDYLYDKYLEKNVHGELENDDYISIDECFYENEENYDGE